MRDPASGLPRTPLLGSWVNNVRCEGGDRQPTLTATRIAFANSLIIERPGARHACSAWGTLSGRCDKSRSEGQGGAAMSHHYSGPDFGFPRGDGRLDYCDLYAFPKPEDSSSSIL